MINFTSNVPLKMGNTLQQVENAASIAIRMLMEETHTKSTPITPKRPEPVGGTLRMAVSKQMIGPMTGVMTWHAPYAEYQERGYGKYPFVHYSTPGTHAHFVEESLGLAMEKLPEFLQMGGLI